MKDTEFARQITEHQRNLFGYIYSLLGNDASSWDVLQETNLVLWRKQEEFQAGTNFKAWAFTVCRFQVMAFIRDRKRSPLDVLTVELLESFAADAEEAALEYEPRLRALKECRKELTEKSLRLLDLHYRDRMPLESVGKATGLTANGVKQALFRARRALMACIENKTPGYL